MDTPKVGFPDNPISRTGKLFPHHYLLEFNGGLDAVSAKIPNLNLIELHFQLFEELPLTLGKLKKYIANARGKGIGFVAHAPFLKDKNKSRWTYMPLNFDFVWPIVPRKYAAAPAMTIGPLAINVLQGTMAQYQKVIDVIAALGIPVLTIHVAKSGIVLDEEDWRAFLVFLKQLNTYSSQKNVKLAIETGGLLEKHMKDIVKIGAGINFDTAHYFLDMLALGKTQSMSNTLTLKAYKKFAKHVLVLHLSQTLPHQDAHLGLLDKAGVLRCNEPILKHAKKTNLPYIILETNPEKASIDHVVKILER